ncbi:MAG: STAS-like domain-containing protein [Lachnospiraceae bacterium]|nr:STAS-like domain-containing protein [Lachnospiraceae bacterium]
MNKYLNVRECIGTPSAITQEAGDLVYEEICKAIDEEKVIELDFKEIESMISPFLNNAIGKLYGKYSGEIIKEYVKLENLPKEKISTINMVISNAKKYYMDKEGFEKVVKGVVG